MGFVRRDREISAVSSLFGNPLVAAALGALLGAVLTFMSHRAAAFVTSEDPMRGLAIVAAMMGVRFVIAIAALGAYFLFARAGLVPFGIALSFSFVAGLAFEAVKLSDFRTFHTPA